MKGFRRLITYGEALKIMFENISIREIESEEVELLDSLGRYASKDIVARYDIPPFDRSAVDGYAVRSSETYGASETNPVELRLIGRITAGEKPSKIPEIGAGEAMKIFTGAPLPRGADAVVMAEHVIEREDSILVLKPVASYQNVSRAGEDFRRGDIIVRRGSRIKPWHIATLAAQNITRVPVFRRLRIGVLSTGSEVIEPGGSYDPESGFVLNSSKPLLLALARDSGCEPIDLGTVPDDRSIIMEKILEGLEKVDIMITTGGSSIGEEDLVPNVVSSLEDSRIVFHGVRIRPGRTIGLAMVRGKPLFMFSGFPVASLVGFQFFVQPYILKAYNAYEEPQPMVRGRIVRRIANPHSTRSFVRVRVFKKNGEILVEPLAITGSGVLSTLTKANGILVIPEDLEGFDEGEYVEVLLIDRIYEG
ncbi:MAG: molybdopterin molybdotransferase MoeA [Sulfolobales archaeon]